MSDSTSSARDSTDQSLAGRRPDDSGKTSPVEADSGGRFTAQHHTLRAPSPRSTEQSGSPGHGGVSKGREPEDQLPPSRQYRVGGRKGKEPHRVARVFPSISRPDNHLPSDVEKVRPKGASGEDTIADALVCREVHDEVRHRGSDGGHDQWPRRSSGSESDKALPADKYSFHNRKLMARAAAPLDDFEQIESRPEKRRLVAPAAVEPLRPSPNQKDASGRSVSWGMCRTASWVYLTASCPERPFA